MWVHTHALDCVCVRRVCQSVTPSRYFCMKISGAAFEHDTSFVCFSFRSHTLFVCCIETSSEGTIMSILWKFIHCLRSSLHVWVCEWKIQEKIERANRFFIAKLLSNQILSTRYILFMNEREREKSCCTVHSAHPLRDNHNQIDVYILFLYCPEKKNNVNTCFVYIF